jgi:hypothetical protein
MWINHVNVDDLDHQVKVGILEGMGKMNRRIEKVLTRKMSITPMKTLKAVLNENQKIAVMAMEVLDTRVNTSTKTGLKSKIVRTLYSILKSISKLVHSHPALIYLRCKRNIYISPDEQILIFIVQPPHYFSYSLIAHRSRISSNKSRCISPGIFPLVEIIEDTTFVSWIAERIFNPADTDAVRSVSTRGYAHGNIILAVYDIINACYVVVDVAGQVECFSIGGVGAAR